VRPQPRAPEYHDQHENRFPASDPFLRAKLFKMEHQWTEKFNSCPQPVNYKSYLVIGTGRIASVCG